MTKPVSGQIWRHWKGAAYRVTGLALHTDDLTPLVLYQQLNSPITYARPLDEWEQQVTASKRRFELLTKDCPQ